MDSLPGPSKIKDHSPERPRKKYKLEDYAHVRSQSSSSHINDLPDEMLIEIFKYLSVTDRLKAEKVCCRWHKLIESKVLWKYINLSDVSPSLLIETLRSLPSYVSHFECHSKTFNLLPMYFPKFIVKLNKQCPSLKDLVLQNMGFNTNNCRNISRQITPSLEYNIMKGALRILGMLDELSESQFHEDVPSLPNLQILALRKVLFSSSFFNSFITRSALPKITVLDLSHSHFIKTDTIEDLFSTFSDLEELYLAGWDITDRNLLTFLTNAKKLRVLDLEFSSVGNDTVSALIQNCSLLEELYLCHTEITGIPITSEMKEFFPHLQTLCLKETRVRNEGIEELLISCPFLKSVNVSSCFYIKNKAFSNLNEDLLEKVHFTCKEIGFCCEHCFKRKYCRYLSSKNSPFLF